MNSWSKIFGILGLLVAVCVLTAWAKPDVFPQAGNLENIIKRTALFGIISIGAAMVIITGGIDLSIGSVVGLVGCLLPMFLNVHYVPADFTLRAQRVDEVNRTVWLEGNLDGLAPGDQLAFQPAGSGQTHTVSVDQIDRTRGAVTLHQSPRGLRPTMPLSVAHLRHTNIAVAIVAVLLIAVAIGLAHGLLITKLGLQPFIVTLCGLLVYRGVARGITGDTPQGLRDVFNDNLRQLANGGIPLAGDFELPIPFLILLAIAVAASVFLNKTVYGRYLFAVGRNEQAARYSGIHTDRVVILAYILCSLLAGVGGILFALWVNGVQPATHGNFYELYAIAAAVLGGCSLRGGEGTILGVVIGAAVMRVLNNSILLLGIPTELEFAIVGGVILAGTATDEIVRRIVARRRAARAARRRD